MEVLVIGKPAINIYLPLQEYPQEGDVFLITGKNESVGGVGAVSACLFAKWGVKPYFTGVLGNDAYGEKIRNTFSEYKVNSKYLETNFEKPTTTNYFILNSKTGNVTKILFNDPDVELQKFKYDFQPDWAILDGSDLAGAMALLNNDQRVRTVYYARRADANTIQLTKKSDYVVCTQSFVENYTKTKIDSEAGTEEYVIMYQKLVDLAGGNNYIVLLNNKKILYCETNKVKMLPEMKINHADVSSFDSVFTATFTFGMMKGLALDDAIKLANTAAAISLSKIGEEPSIPTLDEALDNSGLRDKFTEAKEVLAKAGSNTNKGVGETPVFETQTEETPQPTTEEAQPAPVEQTQEVSQVENTAFGAAPVPTENVVAEPAPMPEAVDNTNVQNVEMPQPQPVEVQPAAQPVEMPQVQQEAPQVPQHEETNIFG